MSIKRFKDDIGAESLPADVLMGILGVQKPLVRLVSEAQQQSSPLGVLLRPLT